MEAKFFLGQAKTWDQANFVAKSEARPTLRPSQARFVMLVFSRIYDDSDYCREIMHNPLTHIINDFH